ncbi:MAG: hypothetical protein HYY85_11510 [Deltaproteobacteria bacterium]|nr:hypothetical protein [Deltaproteobacteria bacterium]
MTQHEWEFTWGFGRVAVQAGFVTANQFLEAIVIQMREDSEGKPHQLIGMILLALGYLSPDQLEQTVREVTAGEGSAEWSHRVLFAERLAAASAVEQHRFDRLVHAP